MNKSTISYLNSFVNRNEDITRLLQMYIDITSSKGGAMFIQDGTNNKHICMEHIYSGIDNKVDVSFKPTGRVNNIIIDDRSDHCGYITTYDVENIIVIPITVYKNHLGVICLVNREEPYTEEMVDDITPYISITQLIMNKHKLMIELKKVYSDTTNFSKDLFLANMSHEIRNPLNGIIGYNQLLMQTDLSSTQKRYLNSMNKCSIQLMQIINDVLDFSKLSSSQISLNIDCFNIKEIIEIVKNALGQSIMKKNQVLNFNITEYVPSYIIMDKQKLIQIIINLVSNANKFSDIGGVINVNFDTVHPNFIQVSVIDNGIGISDQNQCKLFNTFVQLEDSLSKNGTGLGLAICKKLTDLLGGEITVRSSLGEGTTFSFTAMFKEYESFEKDMERDIGILKDKIVLIVDDNADNRILLSELLFEWKMQPVICASGIEALRMIQGDRYDFSLGLVDICMPEINGTNLVKQIKRDRPYFPLIALSSIDSFVNSSEFVQKLEKPVNKVQLFNVIYSIINKKSPSAFLYNDEYTEDNDTKPLSPKSKSNHTYKILIAEDIIYNRNLLVNMLELLQYENIDFAENGQEAFDLIIQARENNESYDILLLDLRMPIMDGYQVIEAIKRRGMELPIIVVVTASVMEADRYKCKELGIKYFINKPIQLSQLEEIMIHVSSNL